MMNEPDYWPDVEVVAEALIEQSTLSGRQIREMLGAAAEARRRADAERFGSRVSSSAGAR